MGMLCALCRCDPLMSPRILFLCAMQAGGSSSSAQEWGFWAWLSQASRAAVSAGSSHGEEMRGVTSPERARPAQVMTCGA